MTTQRINKITLIHSRLKALWTLVFILIVSSCQKDINLEVPVAPSQVVIEGYIENGKHPYVMITRNAPFFGSIDSSELSKYVVTDAVVTVTNGTTTDTLKLTYDNSHWLPVAYETTNMVGEEDKYYSLKVVADGKELTATTKLTKVIKLDSLWFKVDGQRDTLGFVWAHLTDPDTLGNAYRWFAKRLHKDADFIAPQGSVFEDKFINGKSFDFAYDRGHKPNSDAADDNNDERGFFKKGDTIAVRFCSIDRAHFEFWRSIETQLNSNGNPFAAPAPIKSNINGGLGIWGAYAAFYDTTIAK